MPRLTRKNLMALDPETRAKILAAENGGEHEPHAGKPRRQKKRAFAPGEGPAKPVPRPKTWPKFAEICALHGLPEPAGEFRFHPVRKWRFDFAFLAERIAVEVDGGVWNNGGHVRGKYFIECADKRNEAQRLGWRVFSFQPGDLKSGKAMAFLCQIMEKGGAG